MKKRSLLQVSNWYLSVGMLVCIAIWAGLFYAFILEEVSDNIDDGLKDQKIQIIRATYSNPQLLAIREFDLNQFRVRPIGRKKLEELGQNQFSDRFYFMEYDNEMEPYRVLTTTFMSPDGQTYELEIRTSMVEEDDLLMDLALGLVALYAFLVSSLYLINKFTLRRIWQRFHELLHQLKAFRLGESQWKKSEFDIVEFQQLNQSIDEMIAKNEAVWAQQKQFIEHASHELQTPVAIAMNQLEVAMQEKNISENQLQHYAELYEQLQRMAQLNRSLLLLSKIENGQYTAVSTVDLGEVTQRLLERYDSLIDEHELDVIVNAESPCWLQMHTELADIALSNLLRNAIYHSPIGGQIQLSWNASHWEIGNTASENQPLDTERLFRRFQKESARKNSTGLGLSIVETIVKNSPDLQIIYRMDNGLHYFRINKMRS